MKAKFFNVAKKDDELVLSIYGSIGENWDGDGITPQTVSNALKADSKSVTVRINSPGGSAFDGVAIYNLLKSNSRPVNVIVDGMAASAASIIAMAGDSITMATGSVMMIHEGMSMAFGGADDMRKMADTLTTVTSCIADIYVAKSGLLKADVLAMQNVETWMNADEAVAKGFATSISNASAVRNEFKLDTFRNAPDSLKVVASTQAEADPEPETCGCDCEQCAGGDCGTCSNGDCMDQVCDCANQTQNKADPVVNAAPDLSLFAHQLEINRRK